MNYMPTFRERDCNNFPWGVACHAPSGAEKRREREEFFNLELPYLFIDAPTTVIMGGDLNCVLAQADVTGHFNFSHALNTLVTGYDPVDMWASPPERGVYTHYTQKGAARLERIYVSRHLNGRKRGIETTVTAFTDQLAVILRIALDVAAVHHGRGYCKMDAALLRDALVLETLQQRWMGWRRQRNLYPHIVMWWERVAKNQIWKLLIGESAI